jgi:pimeloyl-ACP methyl ester carboxylesterase
MGTPSMKATLNHHRLGRPGGRRLAWVHLRRPRPRGLLFAPPLIGGSAAQQVRLLRPLVRWGFDLVTFDYAGHAGSSGRFCLAGSLEDTGALLARTVSLARRGDRPLLGVGVCAAAVPLLCAAGRLGQPFRGLVLLSPVPHWATWPLVRSAAAALHRRAAGRPPRSATALEALWRALPLDRGRFGILRRERTRLMACALAWFRRPLAGVRLERTPALAVYGNQDPLPLLHSGYEDRLRRLCPQVRLLRLPGGHFLDSASRRPAVAGTVRSFLDGCCAGPSP